MSIPSNVQIEIIRGDSLAIPLTFRDPSDSSLVDVSGYHLRMTVKVSSYQPDDLAVISKDITLPPESSNGTYTLYITPEDSMNVTAMTYEYDIQLSTPDKADVITLVKGKLSLLIGTTWGN